MKAAVLATLAGSAVAFAPVQQATRTSTAVSATEAQRDFFGITGGADFSKELGVQPPVSFYLQFPSSLDDDEYVSVTHGMSINTYTDISYISLIHIRLTFLIYEH